MGLSGGQVIIKYLMFIFNLVFFLIGCGILGLGIWLKIERNGYIDITDYSILTAANLAIAMGCVVLVVAFLGCCGAIKEIPSMLLAFFVLMLIIFILEITAGGLAYAKREEIEKELEKSFKDAINTKYFKPDESGVTKAIDDFQKTFRCCGYTNFSDWKNSFYNKRTFSVPKSCCIKGKESDELCGSSLPEANAVYYSKGCFKEVVMFVKDNLLYIWGCAVAFAVLQVLGMVFAMILYCKIRANEKGTFA